MLKYSLLFAGILYLSGCVSISPEFAYPNVSRDNPIYESVALSGLQFEGELQEVLRHSVYAYSITRSIISDAPIRLEGKRIGAVHDTDSNRIAWNVINTVGLIFLLGGPYLGSASADFEIHAYGNDRLLRIYKGKGKAYWKASYQIGANIPQARDRALHRAELLAVLNAVEKVAKDPVHIETLSVFHGR